MKIVIGKDNTSHYLYIMVNGKKSIVKTAGNAPVDISEKHCMIEYSEGKTIICNLDINNYTYVNGRAVEKSQIRQGDAIELGASRFPIPWNVIDSSLPHETSIRHLESIWNKYENERISLQVTERKFNTLRSATGLITMTAIVLGMITGRQSVWFIIIYLLAIFVSLAFTVKAYHNASKIPQKQQNIQLRFQKEYVCPHCKHFLGIQSYEMLLNNGYCPTCKTKFIH
ncbi:MAG: FHA domain-containing protein [Prevotella sp.]|nr:FHA domain-containing protein [Prevotella sp.]MBR1462444.1 FHA domain-containing protein [Prevotella sp.]